MAPARIDAPGQPYGPCAKRCKHVDCAESRRIADALCGWCKKKIGYETKFYGIDKPRHADCEQERLGTT